MTVFLTGATGQLGSVLKTELLSHGHKIIAPGHRELDICDSDAVMKAVLDAKPDAIVNCVAYNYVDKAESEQEECMKLNTAAAGYLAQAARAVGAKIMHFSTDYIFDGEGTEPIPENAPVGPLNIYGKSKADSEALLRSITDRHFIVRVSWLYSLTGGNFVNTMLRLGATRPVLNVVSDQIGSPTYAPALAKPLADMLESDKFGTYNLTSDGFVSWYDFARAIFMRAKLDVTVLPVTSEEYASAARRPKNSRLSKEKAYAEGFGPTGTWQEQLDMYFAEREILTV